MFFFSQDLINAKKNSPLAIIWIAATLQSQKKLSKKQVNSVNVTSICRYLEEPDEEMALRLRANLMVGVVRVYRQQTDYLYSDINSVLINFKKALYDLQSGSADLNMAREEANVEAITLPENDIDQLPGFNELAFSLNLAPHLGWIQSSQTTQRSIEQISSGFDQSSLAYGGLGPVSSSPGLGGIGQGVIGTRTGTSVSSKPKNTASDISLPSFDQDLNFQTLERQQSSHRDLLLSNGGGGDQLDLFGDDFIHGQDMLHFDFNDDFGDRPEFPIDGTGAQFQSLTSWDQPQTSDQVKSSSPDPNAQLPTPKKRRREAKRPKLVDDQTILIDSEMKQARDIVNEELERNGLKMYRKSKRQPTIKELINMMVDRVPTSFQTIYRSCIEPPLKKKKIEEGLKQHLGRSESRDAYMHQSFNDDFGDGPIGLFQEQSPPPEIGRADSDIMPWHAPPSGTGTGTGSVKSKASKNSTPLKPVGLDFLRSDKSDAFESGALMPSSSDIGLAPVELNSFASIEELVGSMTQLEEKDQEIRSFQIYVASLMDDGQVYLNDFISTFPRRTASSAFFNLLMCCHRGVFKAEQQNTDIRIFV